MRIAIITNDLLAQNGWSKYSLDLGEELIKKGNEVIFITSKSSDRGFSEFVILEDSNKYIANPIACFISAQKIRTILKNFNPDVVHAVVEPYGHILPWIGKYKKIITVHGTYSWMPALLGGYKKAISTLMSRKMFDSIDAVISVSNFTKRHLESFIGIEDFFKKVHVITNGTKVNSFIGSRDNHLEFHKILCVGMIKPRKGIKEMLRGLSSYKKISNSKFKCEVIGKYNTEDQYYKEVKQMIRDLDLEHEIELKGVVTQEELDKSYLEADLYLMTPISDKNEFEGFGLVYLEAASRRTPSIGSLGSGAEESILEGKSGFLVDPFNPEQVGEAIDSILNKHLISKEDCIKWAEQNSISKKVDEIIAVYKK